ncbi:Bacterial capsule synthesis protein PGA_cap [uncultured archaeon]|nr:Bacterial capsule synthesis protein PGA_cap [uncultured archaeon]
MKILSQTKFALGSPTQRSGVGLKIAFIGDVMLGRLVNTVLKLDNYSYVWGSTLDVLKRADLRFANLECVISDKGMPWSPEQKIFHFRAHPSAIKVLRKAKIDYVSLANNHTLDYNTDAMLDMTKRLRDADIAFSGVGRNLSEASAPAIVKKNDTTIMKPAISSFSKSSATFKIAIISLTDNEPEWEAEGKLLRNDVSSVTMHMEDAPWEKILPIRKTKAQKMPKQSRDHGVPAAENGRPGVFYVPLRLTKRYEAILRKSIQNAKKNSDIVIVAAHVGPHFRTKPSKFYVNFAHKIIDLGADIYWGHSNHVPQGIEVYGNKLIMYDAGDFIDDYATDRYTYFSNDQSFIFIVTIDDKKIKRVELFPVKISSFMLQTNRAEKEEAREMCDNMEKACYALDTITARRNNEIVIEIFEK